jgi:hypothetical protein
MKFACLAACSLFVGLVAASAGLGAPGSRAVLEHVPPARLIGHSNSLNWSGYASFNSTFTDVKGTWTQPAANCNGKSTYASFWVGLDGYDSSTVEQLGTEADCSHGKPVDYAWWEMFPNVSHVIGGFAVSPGVSYTAEVQSIGGDDFALTLSGGGNTPFTLTTQLGLDPALSSAEWIAEAPSLCAKSCHELPLTNFGTVSFSGASANGSAIDNGAWSFDPLTMVTSGGGVKAAPSSLDPAGSGFSVTWHHS